ncbi:MAG TPA: alkaline phosphatase family protein, partial [Acidimicrobiia bacterium]|nr:alkaline phosphatase family protein [Acidimicrobiia bacterium]
TTKPTVTSAPQPTTTTTPPIRKPGSLPDPSKPEGTETLEQIQHIVIVMQENHSFDSYFGMLGRGDGFAVDAKGQPRDANPVGDGTFVRAFHWPGECQVSGLPGQDWGRSHTSWNNGRNDGFVKASTGVAMGYWDETDIPFYYALARTFPVCDRWFCSTLAQTYPNRRFLMAGTAAGIVLTSAPSLSISPPPNGTILDRLARHKITWKNYFTDLPGTAVIPQEIGPYPKSLANISEFARDAAAGKLPAISYVDPNFTHESEENPQDIRRGENFTHNVVQALFDSPLWPKSLLIFCYDEHGGYYDHVPPPRAIPPDHIKPGVDDPTVHGAYDHYGFRVPAVIVSPYAKRDYVSHVVHDQTSILKLIETKWNLPAMTYRDANADNLLDSLDFANPPAFLEPPKLPGPGALGTCEEGVTKSPVPPANAIVSASEASSLRIGATS